METKKRIFVLSGKTGKKVSSKVDTEMWPLLNLHKWRLNSDGYALTYLGGKCVLMHEFVCVKTFSQVVDHINFDKLDNRRENLKAVSNSENLLRNKSRMRKDLGVALHGASGKWRARIAVKGTPRELYVGLFDTKRKAISARNRALKELKNGR